MALDLQSLSITSSIKNIIDFFKSQENNSRWKDLTEGSEGLFLIRFLANIISTISYKLVTARREIYLSTANLLSSLIGLSINLGYSVFRGTNQKRLVELVPNGTYTIEKFSVIGTYNDDYDIICLEDIALSEGVNTEVLTAIGKVGSETFTAGTSDIKTFTLFTQNISEDVLLLKDGERVPTTKIIKELKDDKYLVRTNPFKSVDILYLNNSLDGAYKYGTETEFELRYIELADTPTFPYTSEMFTYGGLNNTLTIDNYVPFEGANNIKVNAPLDHEVQNLIRSKADYSQRVKQEISNIVETSYKPLTPTYTQITYLKDDYSILRNDQITELNTILDDQNFFGTPLPDIVFPKKERISLDIFIKLRNRFKDVSEITTDIQNILKSNYKIALNQTFNIFDLEELLDELSYVKYARPEFSSEARQNETKYYLGDIIEVDSNYYKASSVLGISGTTEPNWNLPVGDFKPIDTGLETNDSSIVWQAYKKLPNIDNINEWQASTKYKIGDIVCSDNFPNYMFKCVDLLKSSKDSALDVSDAVVGDFIVDGRLMWVVKSYNPSLDDREISTIYRVGDAVNVGSTSLECIGYLGLTEASPPNFELPEYTIVNTASNYFEISGNYSSFFEEDDIIKAITENTYYSLTVDSVSYDGVSNRTRIDVKQTLDLGLTYLIIEGAPKGTLDGELFWEIIRDNTKITYDWNVYNDFTFNLTTG